MLQRTRLSVLSSTGLLSYQLQGIELTKSSTIPVQGL
jgi:hypothetical protein